MLFKNSGIGLDIGSKKIKLARVKKAKKGLELVDFASMPTPEGLIEQGKIAAPEKLGKAIFPLVNEMGWKGQKVVSALPSQEVFCANYILPRMGRKESREAALFQSSSFMQFSLDEAVSDIYFLDEIDKSEGRKREIFFIAAENRQVGCLNQVCRLAGLRLSVVEIPALAVRRLWHNNETKELYAFLDIGFSHASLSVFKQHKLLFQRSFSPSLAGMSAALAADILPEEVDIIDRKPQGLAEEFSGRVKQMLASFQREEREMPVGQLYLWGGGARLKGLAEYLSMALNTAAAMLTAPDNLYLSPKTEEYWPELGSEFPAAIGLASRGVWG